MLKNMRWRKFKTQDWRTFLGKIYLDIAEKLPKFEKGLISHLQTIRKDQREDSEKAYNETRPPSGVELEFRVFRMVELYPVEEIENLDSGLRKLFPHQKIERRIFNDLPRRVKSITSSFHGVAGLIVKNKPFFAFHPTRVLSQLPEEVDNVEISIQHILPSIVAVSFDVYLSELATSNLDKIISKRHLPKIKFRKIIPWGVLAGGYTEYPAYKAMEEEISDLFESLRLKTENILRPYFNGLFLGASTKEKPSLPAVEVFLLKGFSGDKKEIDLLRERNYQWWVSLGLDFIGNDTFKNDWFLYMLGNRNWSFKVEDRVFILSDKCIKDKEDEKDEVAKKIHDLKYTLDSIMPSRMILKFLEYVQVEIESQRLNLFKKVTPRFSIKDIKKEMRLGLNLQQYSVYFERIRIEFQNRKDWLISDLKQTSDLARLDNKKEEVFLKDILIDGISWKIDLLSDHIALVKSEFSKLLSLQSMLAMHRLQQGIFLLTLVVTILTIGGFLLNLEKIKNYFEIYINAWGGISWF